MAQTTLGGPEEERAAPSPPPAKRVRWDDSVAETNHGNEAAKHDEVQPQGPSSSANEAIRLLSGELNS